MESAAYFVVFYGSSEKNKLLNIIIYYDVNNLIFFDCNKIFYKLKVILKQLKIVTIFATHI